jgi:zinc and cadmium transporter
MTLLYIVVATLAGGILSVLVAASLTVALLGRVVQGLVSLSAGVLLGTSLLHVLPEAFESKSADAHDLFLTLLIGLLSFWLLEKAELYRHGHHHEGDGHHHHHEFDAHQAGKGGFSILLGDSIHNFCDGVIIAAAFLADVQLGIVTALAVVAHEIPQEAGDYIVLLNAGFVVGPWESLFPYLLVVASSSFIYVAVADLLPQLQQRLSFRQVLVQVAWLAAGLGLVMAATSALHVH